MASFDETLLDEDDLRGARRVALALLGDASTEHTRLLENSDPEALHDFRVAVRRLRSWLRARKDALNGSIPKAAQKDLRRVARLTNDSRDAEVFAAWLASLIPTLAPRQRTGARWLHARAVERGRVAAAAAKERVNRRFTSAREALEDRLPFYRQTHHLDEGTNTAPFAAALALELRTHGHGLTRRLDRVRTLTDDEAAHRARIAGKRLRYLLEPVAATVAGGQEVIGQLKDLQDTLGGVHDAHVWLAAARTDLERWGTEETQRLSRVARIEDESDPMAVPARGSRLHSGVLAVAVALRQHAKAHFDALQQRWGSEQARTLEASIDTIARELEAHAPAGVEIERKYLLQALPDPMPAADVVMIDQGYLPGRRLVERLRRETSATGESLTRTVKSGSGIARAELEEATTPEIFDAMWPLTQGRRVTKRRHRVAEEALTWEIDEFTDRDLVVAEVELVDPEQEPELPGWLAPFVVREVTGEPEYVNANLAR